LTAPEPQTRRKARENALQFLFGLEFTHEVWEKGIEVFWAMQTARPGVKEYATTLIRGVSEYRDALNEEITPILERWAPDRVGRIEWTVLRIALYEIRHVPDVPRAVAINEAIELAKIYGADGASRFINGVLDRLGCTERPEDRQTETSKEL